VSAPSHERDTGPSPTFGVCWVIRYTGMPADSDPVVYDDDGPDVHYATRQAAEDDAAEITRERAEDDEHWDTAAAGHGGPAEGRTAAGGRPGARPRFLAAVPLSRTCVQLDCVSCGETLSDPDTERGLHFSSWAEAEDYARDSGWSTDGLDWRCAEHNCPPLEDPYPPIPVCPGQLLLPGLTDPVHPGEPGKVQA
jgi:hypothetical protein